MSKDPQFSDLDPEKLLHCIKYLLSLKISFKNKEYQDRDAVKVVDKMILLFWGRGCLEVLKNLKSEGVDIKIKFEESCDCGDQEFSYLESAKESGNQEVIKFAEELSLEK